MQTTVSDARTWWEDDPFHAHMHGPDAALPLLVQFGLPTCALCPQATTDVKEMQDRIPFVHVHCDAHSDLAVELDIALLPALLVFHGPTKHVLYQKLRDNDVKDVIRRHCVQPADQPLDTKADF